MESEVTVILKKVQKQMERKKKLYDGFNSLSKDTVDQSISRFMMSITEEHGEVASALIRERYQSALDETIDIIHSAILLYLAIEKKKKEDDLI